MKVCNCRNINDATVREVLKTNYTGKPIKLERSDADHTLTAVYKDCSGGCDFHCGKCEDHLADLGAEHNRTVAAVEKLRDSLPQPLAAPATIKPQSNDPVC